MQLTTLMKQLTREFYPFLLWLAVAQLYSLPTATAQTINEEEQNLVTIYTKMDAFYNIDSDSLEYYSSLFTKRLTLLISQNPETISYPFPALQKMGACDIVTAPDGKFRIYSWDSRLGGTMIFYKNYYQYKLGSKVFSTDLGTNEDGIGAVYTDLFQLNYSSKTYYLAISGGSVSTKDKYQSIRIYTIDSKGLNTNTLLLKTPQGKWLNSIGIEYDFFSVMDRPERPLRLINYDTVNKIIYIPIVFENGVVTDRYILYRFNGQYFEHFLTQRKPKKRK